MRQSFAALLALTTSSWQVASALVTPRTPPGATASYFATTLSGLEHVLARELESPNIGAAGIREGRLGVHFEGTPDVGARAVLWCRSAMRVMELLDQRDDVNTQSELYDMCYDLPWTELLQSESQTLSVSSVLSLDRAMSSGRMRPGDWVCPSCSSLVFASKDECFSCGTHRDADPLAGARRRLGQQADATGNKGSEPLTHSFFTALTVKNAACDVLREARGWRPSIDKEDADLPLWLHVHRGDARIYRVLSGSGSMHRRGYREGERVHKAAMKETLAAAMLLHAGYDGRTQSICDPMCGSGTLVIEAALIATNTAPGLLRPRPPPLVRWPGGEYAAAWRRAVAEAEAARLPFAPRAIMANEIHGGALTLARRGSRAAGVEEHIRFSQGCAGDYTPAEPPNLVISNPPWGLRLDEELAAESWSILGDFLKRECRAPGNEAWLLSGNRELTRHLRLRARSRHPVEQADDSLRIICYDMGPAQEKRQDDSSLGDRQAFTPAGARPTGAPSREAGAGRAAALEAPARPVAVRRARPALRRNPAAAPGQKVVLDGTGLSGEDLDAVFADLYN
jgi:putative N6-adenine-specific DNA methylase